MHILLFVVSMIMVLSIMTYSKLLSFREHAMQRYELYRDMDQLEAGYLNTFQQRAFHECDKSSSLPNKKKDPKGDSEAPLTKLDRKFDLSYLLFYQKRKANPLKSEASLRIFKRLIEGIYKEDPYFKKITERISLDDFLEEVIIKLDQESTISEKKIKDLSFSSSDYNTLWTMILDSSLGYPSILDFIKVGKLNSYKNMSVYLARSELLHALYQDKNTVERLMIKRMEIYRDLKNKRVEKKIAEEDLRLSFGQIELEENVIDLIDFGVSTTKPDRCNTTTY